MKALPGLALLMAIGLAGAAPPSSTAPQRITIEAKRFSFTPSEITIRKSQPVTLVIGTGDVTHGLVMKELGIRTEVKKGKTSMVTFTPEKTGTFIAKCAYFCGVGHGSMKLTIHVTD